MPHFSREPATDKHATESLVCRLCDFYKCVLDSIQDSPTPFHLIHTLIEHSKLQLERKTVGKLPQSVIVPDCVQQLDRLLWEYNLLAVYKQVYIVNHPIPSTCLLFRYIG